MTNSTSLPSEKVILAFVGMPGAGKSEAVSYIETKGIPFVRFGDITEEAVTEANLPLNPENERVMREKIRKEEGMGAYAVRAKAKIEKLLEQNNIVAIDGLYSWEEYTYLKQLFPRLTLIHIYAEPNKRYERLANRAIRPVPLEKCYTRDVSEIENLNKGGPIAIADYIIENNDDDMNHLYSKLDILCKRLAL
jgi:dephospho-CoA kinase